jgi:hypothetical protein
MKAMLALVISVALAPTIPDQAPIDFSGTWIWDAARSEDRAVADRLVVMQSATTITLRSALCCRQAGEEWITTYHFNSWGSRDATPANPATPARGTRDTKPSQARWDGEALLLHAGPELDRNGGSLRVWRLAASGSDLIEQVVHRGLGLRFDFKEASIPALYTRDRHVYTRQSAEVAARKDSVESQRPTK